MGITFDYYSISLLIGGFSALISGFVVYIHNHKTLENISWFFFNLTSAIWSFGYFATINATTSESAFIYDWILHIAAILVPLFCLLSVVSITDTYKKNKIVIIISAILGLFFLVITPTKLFINGVIPKAIFNFVPDAGPLYIYFTIYFFALAFYILYILFKKYYQSKDIEHQRYKYIIFFTAIGSVGGGSVFFLTFNIPILPYPLILFSLFPLVSIYAIFRYQLFNIKVITTEVLVFSLWIFILVRTLLSVSLVDRLINIGLLISIVVAGILLMRSVLLEVKQRERLQLLTTQLSIANEKLKGLDKLKTEFVSLASHQLRSPLTAIKGYTSMLAGGDYGEINPEAKKAIDIIMESSNNLTLVVEDLLNVTKIEQGGMKYEMAKFDFGDEVRNTAKDLSITAEKKGLKLLYNIPEDKKYNINGDKEKLRQVLVNLIDNSMKYTKEGQIDIELKLENEKVTLSIKDTGVGVSDDVKNKLFKKFSRDDRADLNTSGSGLGLYLVKEIVDAHKGRVWVESEGHDKGSTFFVELNEEK